MAMTAHIYDHALYEMTTTGLYWDLGGDDFKVVLMTNDYIFDSSHVTYADLTNEISGGNYITGGHALTLVETAFNEESKFFNFDADDLIITNLTNTFRKIAIYNATMLNTLLLYIDLGEDQVISAADFTFIWNSTGVWSAKTQ